MSGRPAPPQPSTAAALMVALGKAIRNARHARGLSQEAFADRAQFDRTYPSLLERGLRDPKYSTLQRVCAALDCTLLDLLCAAHGSPADSTSPDGGVTALPLLQSAGAQRLALTVTARRRALALTCATVAKRCGWRASELRNLERGLVDLRIADLKPLARALNCTPLDLLGLAGSTCAAHRSPADGTLSEGRAPDAAPPPARPDETNVGHRDARAAKRSPPICNEASLT